MNPKIGLFFGSFNPIHIGHVILANYMQQYTEMDKVWMVVSPQNPFKEKKTLLDDNQRLYMVNLALEEYVNLQSSNIEFSLPQPSYTIDTLAYLEEKYPDYDFSLIMGEDNLAHLHKWKNYENLIKNYEIYVYPRLHEVKKIKIPEKYYHKVEAPIIEISATRIREMIREGKVYRPYLPPEVFPYIDGSNFYK